MTADDADGRACRPRPALAWRIAAGLAMLLFLALVARFYDRTTGFTSLLLFGSELEATQVPEMRAVRHYVYPEVIGYDGAFYAQLALHPLLRDPVLRTAIDNPQYRARRMLMPWTAWLLGAGRPAWIVHVFPLLNVACWLGLAVLLWRWLPPDGAQNFLRWAGVLFSHGLCASVRGSLVDGPALLLTAAAVAWWENNRPRGAAGWLAAAVLTRETSVLAGTVFAAPPVTGRSWWARNAALAAIVAGPLVLWLGYVRLQLGPAVDAGARNFALPFAGLAEKWAAVWWGSSGGAWLGANLVNVVCLTALTVQLLFFASRWRPSSVWWRVGASFAVLMLFLAEPVWEGYPGAAPRVLLPMTLAFNLLVPASRRWLPVLLAGNLSVAAGLAELASTPREVLRFAGDARAVAACHVSWDRGWYQTEWTSRRAWRWCGGRGAVRIENRAGVPLAAEAALDLWGITPRRVTVRVNGGPPREFELTDDAVRFALPGFVLRPGINVIEFASTAAEATSLGDDSRPLNFAVSEMIVTVTPAGPEAGQ